MNLGIQYEITELVNEQNTASSYGSGLLPVYATPAMIALMEKCACACVAPYLEDGTTTVGTRINVRHISASPLGIKITCTATLIEADGRKLTFNVEAKDEAGLIGEGTHERFIIDTERFMTKCKSKLIS